MPVAIDYRNHVCSVFRYQLKQAFALSQLAADSLQLTLLVNRVNIEDQDESGQSTDPLFEVQ
jgi:hypothetical protein